MSKVGNKNALVERLKEDLLKNDDGQCRDKEDTEECVETSNKCEDVTREDFNHDNVNKVVTSHENVDTNVNIQQTSEDKVDTNVNKQQTSEDKVDVKCKDVAAEKKIDCEDEITEDKVDTTIKCKDSEVITDKENDANEGSQIASAGSDTGGKGHSDLKLSTESSKDETVPLVPVRTIGKPKIERHKRQWGAIEKEKEVAVSSQTLKDIVPHLVIEEKSTQSSDDLPMEENATKMSDDLTIGEKSRKKNDDDDIYVHVSNLVRPFTLNQLRSMLSRTGVICEGGFHVNKIKSECVVQFQNVDEASETVMALDQVTWPSSNPKALIVKMVSEKVYKDFVSKFGEDNPREEPLEKKYKKEKTQDNDHSQPKALEELFEKTKTVPNLYWKRVQF